MLLLFYSWYAWQREGDVHERWASLPPTTKTLTDTVSLSTLLAMLLVVVLIVVNNYYYMYYCRAMHFQIFPPVMTVC